MVELGPEALAMDRHEVVGLLAAVEVELADADIAALVERTEGLAGGPVPGRPVAEGVRHQ